MDGTLSQVGGDARGGGGGLGGGSGGGGGGGGSDGVRMVAAWAAVRHDGDTTTGLRGA